jgi:hypothetical protein
MICTQKAIGTWANAFPVNVKMMHFIVQDSRISDDVLVLGTYIAL